MKYLVTFIAEFIHAWKHRQSLRPPNCKSNLLALIAWSDVVARYCSTNNHPWRFCINRTAWEKWMQL